MGRLEDGLPPACEATQILPMVRHQSLTVNRLLRRPSAGAPGRDSTSPSAVMRSECWEERLREVNAASDHSRHDSSDRG